MALLSRAWDSYFLKSKNVFSRGFFLKILALCMISIQERVIVARVRYTQLVIGGFILVLWSLIFLFFLQTFRFQFIFHIYFFEDINFCSIIELLGFNLTQFDSIWLNLTHFYFLEDIDFSSIIKELKFEKPLISMYFEQRKNALINEKRKYNI